VVKISDQKISALTEKTSLADDDLFAIVDSAANPVATKKVKWSTVNNLTVSETEIFNGTAPTDWTDLDLSAVVGANSAMVLLKISNPTLQLGNTAVRKNGDTDDFLVGAAGGGCAAIINSAATYFNVVLVTTDTSGIIEWKATAARAGTTVDIMAYIK